MARDKAYDAKKYESALYEKWLAAGVFDADPTSTKERFSIAMPPPNETGTLSLGHALFITLQDIMARHARQQGKDVLWLPGTDHAALAVNAIIEKKLSDENTNKHEIGREAFLARTREFVGGSRDTMLKQMRAMGASADWTRLRYTLDDALNRMVNETFTKMYETGLIYRGHRIVNWDPNLETNVSDDEMQHVEETTTFYTFQYGPFEIATARPETKFGDKYVVMHPDDERYKQYKHGDTFEAEWINGPVTATVIKDEAIDMQFGTGVMTITPWHDHTDFDIAERHNLDKEQIIDFHGKLLPIAEEFAGMPIEEARGKIVEKLRAKGLVVKEEQGYVHNVAINERGKGKIEPQIRLQWFVDVNKPAVEWKGAKKSLKEVLRNVIDSKDITITPNRFEKTYFHWIDNLRDWCISRQIWWGHRIPVWYRGEGDTLETFVGTQPPADTGWEQDPDTLDTWFSSALWTWSALIDQEKAADYSLNFDELLAASPDFKAYHPTSIMETGWDILFFWVARMILATTFMTGQVPFKQVYLHGMVRAEDGKKMSKSRPESIIDPLEVIPKYGTDALRMALIWGTSPGLDFSWSTPKIETTRNFCNKLWNVARYIDEKLGDTPPAATPEAITEADHWVLQKLHLSSQSISKHLVDLKFSEAFDQLFHLVWDDVADWYIEASKAAPNLPLLNYVLQTILQLTHPFAPFVSEAIWQERGGVGMLTATAWPSVPAADTKKAAVFTDVMTLVSEVRELRATLGNIELALTHTSDEFFTSQGALLAKLARLSSVSETSAGKGLRLTGTAHECWLAIDQSTAQQVVAKLTDKQTQQQGSVDQLKARLGNTSYVQNAPAQIVEDTKKQLTEAEEQLARTTAELARFSS
jgi:valyl-tRNA synthetase